MDQQHQNILRSKLLRSLNDIPNFYQLTPQELEEKSNHTINQQTWRDFLDEESTRQLIQRRLTEDTEIAHRKAMQALAKEAQRGNVQAIKELNQLSGILNQNNNKQFITHYIPRPEAPTENQTGNTPKSKEVNTNT